MRHEVRLADHGTEYVGTYRIDGWMLELTCCYGTLRVPLGLFEEKALARKLIKHLAHKAARAVATAAPHPAPHPATIAVTKAAAAMACKPKLQANTSTLTGWSNTPPVRAAIAS